MSRADYPKDPCEHGERDPHVIKSLGSGKFFGCYGGPPSEEAVANYLETRIRNNPGMAEVSGAVAGLLRSGTHREQALYFIRENGGATNDQISAWMDDKLGQYVPPNQVASRTGELVEGGWVHPNGEHALTRRNGLGTVYKFYEDLGVTRADLPH